MAEWSAEDLALFAGVGGVPIQLGVIEDGEWNFGWFPLDPLTDARLGEKAVPFFSTAASALRGSGEGKTILLYEAARQVWGRDLDTGPQELGDCVSWAFAGAIDLLACVEIVAGQAEEYSWGKRVATEVIYALSRREFGSASRWRDGSSSVWASDAVVEGGTLSREEIGPYDPKRAKKWGNSGLPDELEPRAREHRVSEAALVMTFSDARDAIANGYPVAVGSNQGFRTQRDDAGFCAASGKWGHCMKFIASRDDARPGLLCMNSWGNDSPTGPSGEHDIPDGSFWVDAAVCDSMLAQRGGFALSGFSGYQHRAELLERLFGASG